MDVKAGCDNLKLIAAKEASMLNRQEIHEMLYFINNLILTNSKFTFHFIQI